VAIYYCFGKLLKDISWNLLRRYEVVSLQVGPNRIFITFSKNHVEHVFGRSASYDSDKYLSNSDVSSTIIFGREF
jgi:hypothetical protein